jgi:hypothetical protein
LKLLLSKAAVVAVATVAAVVGTAAPGSATSGWKWATSSTYGQQGQNLIGSGLRVGDIAATYVPPNNDYLSGHAWRFVISTYGCDPRGKTKKQCKVRTYYPGRLRKGNPPAAGSQCATIGGEGGSVQWCRNYGASFAYASHGDFPTYGSRARKFSNGTWICTELQVNSNSRGTGSWHFNGTGKGLRACAEVRG